MKIVVDTSVFIDYVRANKGIYLKLIEVAGGNKVKLYIPSIVIVELWSGESMKDKSAQAKMKKLMKRMKIMLLTRQVSEKTGDLLRSKLIIETEDAIVAATALYLDAQLATSNKKHFEEVKGLRLFEAKKKLVY